MTTEEQELTDEIKQFEIEHPDETITPLEYAYYRYLQGQLKGRQEARKEVIEEVENWIIHETDLMYTMEFENRWNKFKQYLFKEKKEK